MAGSIVATQSTVGVRSNRVWKYDLVWTSDASGNVSGITTTLIPGSILAVTFVPGSGGTQPTDLYDITMKCVEHNVADVFSGEGANLSNATSSHRVPFILATGGTSFVRQWLHGGDYQLVVANAGNAKTGTVDIYVSPTALA